MDEQNTPHENTTQGTPKRAPRTKVLGFVVILIIILAGAYYFTVYAPEGNTTGEEAVSGELSDDNTSQAATEQEILETVERAGRHILLPSGETPVMATVVDAAVLQAEQPFYQNVVNGDRVLVYQQAQRAIIYSPSRDLIVNVGPVVVDAPAEEVAE
ncbi:MAG: hypothetical protein WD003_00485 [Candidatus Paceibacterota bacterium]